MLAAVTNSHGPPYIKVKNKSKARLEAYLPLAIDSNENLEL